MTLLQELRQAIKLARKPDGSVGESSLRNGWIVHIEADYLHGSGAYRAWKHLYFLIDPEQHKLGGYDRADSFAQWAMRKMT